MSKGKPYATAPILKPSFSWEALEFIRPLAEWYSYMSEDDKRKLPIRVLNALDSCKELMSVR